MTMTPKSFCKLRLDGPFENTHKVIPRTNWPTARKASQCTGFHTMLFLTKRFLWIDISVVIIPILLGRLYCWFGVNLSYHNSPSCILYFVYICLWPRYVCLNCYLLCQALLLIFCLVIACIVLLICCTTNVSLEFPTIYQNFPFVPLACRFYWKVHCLFCIFCF